VFEPFLHWVNRKTTLILKALRRGAPLFNGLLTKGAHVAIEGELHSHEYQRELAE
jgi:hypothetical protein